MKASGLRGRGGAGFPTGMKWSFVPHDTGKPTYVVVNFDESEPGTCNNRELVERDPHRLLEGTAIAALAIGCHTAFIYVPGRVPAQSIVLERGDPRGLRRRVTSGRDRRDATYDLDIVLHRGAGAYICGEETALLNSLEGFRGQPRLRPPFPAVEGLYASPTVINNVETLMNVPDIVLRGAEWFRERRDREVPGHEDVHDQRQGRASRATTSSRSARRSGSCSTSVAGGVLGGRCLKAWTPGGSSTPLLTADHVDVAARLRVAWPAAGSLLGTGAVMVLDDTDCVVDAAQRMTRFYAHESCGKCTPCREGTWWAERVLGRIEDGYGREEDLPVMRDMGDEHHVPGLLRARRRRRGRDQFEPEALRARSTRSTSGSGDARCAWTASRRWRSESRHRRDAHRSTARR